VIDPENPVVKLCAEGMQAELRGYDAAALALYVRAWNEASDDFEASIAAHYIARHQDDPNESLRWNEVALARAEAVPDNQAGAFFPSLYLCVGRSHEVLGNAANARQFYEAAEAGLDRLPSDDYGAVVRAGVTAALARFTC
jgi:hypothetical protein